MNEKAITVEVNFQDTRVPIYRDFRNIEEGYTVLFGTNKKNIENKKLGLSLGKIEDVNGVQVDYIPFSNRSSFDEYVKFIEKCSVLPLEFPIWMLGKFTPSWKLLWKKFPSILFAYSLGKKEEFKRPDLLE